MLKTISNYCSKDVASRLVKAEARSAAWEEFTGILSLKAYWFAFFSVGLLISVTGSFDTDYIQPTSLRVVAMTGYLLGSGIACAAIAGFYRALTGISALRRFDVVIKIGVVWIPLGTMPSRILINHLGGVPFSWEQLFRSAIHGSSVMLLVVVIMYVFGQRPYMAKKRKQRLDATSHNWPQQEYPSLAKASPAVTSNGEADFPKPSLTPKTDIRLPYYIESEDHYLKVVYRGKVEFVRANLSEVAARFSAGGLRCHKSYWVSRAAIERRRWQGRQLLLVLKDGTEIPVGRSFEKAVRASLKTRTELALVV